MNTEEKGKLKTLLNYWMDHNKEHSLEFREWAEKARSFGEAEICEQVLQASRAMDKASEFLSQALGKLEAKER